MGAIDESRWVTKVGWNDVPHLTEEAKAELKRTTPPYLRRARMYGDPVLGVGRIYTIDFEDVKVRWFPIPDDWPRVYGLDVGWNVTAAVWTAWDRHSDTIYAYDEYIGRKKPPHTHAAAIGMRGKWMPGVIDPASRQRNQRDGTRLIDDYRHSGLLIHEADNAVESGIMKIQDLLTTGNLKFLETMPLIETEYNMYHRDENGKVVKSNDHLMDALRYVVNSGGAFARVKHEAEEGTGWRGARIADKKAGY